MQIRIQATTDAGERQTATRDVAERSMLAGLKELARFPVPRECRASIVGWRDNANSAWKTFDEFWG